MQASPSPAPLLVACLCAQWCGTCGAYAGAFAAVAREHPAARLVWIDIETHADALGEAALDIENFPTVLVLRGAAVVFYGTLLPHAATLARLLQAAEAGALAPGAPCPPELATAVQALGRQLPALA
jgi:thiol-disulfide isomerase/thioredoxin